MYVAGSATGASRTKTTTKVAAAAPEDKGNSAAAEVNYIY
jgi:hypothetical protein